MCFCSWIPPRPPGIERLSLIFERLLSVLSVSTGLQTDSRHGSLSFEENRLGVGMFSRDLQPGCDNGCERASTGKDYRAPIIASPHPAPVFYPAEAILDSMASLVELGIVDDFITSDPTPPLYNEGLNYPIFGIVSLWCQSSRNTVNLIPGLRLYAP